MFITISTPTLIAMFIKKESLLEKKSQEEMKCSRGRRRDGQRADSRLRMPALPLTPRAIRAGPCPPPSSGLLVCKIRGVGSIWDSQPQLPVRTFGARQFPGSPGMRTPVCVMAKALFACTLPVHDTSGVFNVNLGSDVLEASHPPHRRGNSPKLENEN